MYARCLFCTGDLGRNEAVEAFPVGRRLAFDAAKGRLWVVCPRCARWNLTPLEERWEAIEQAERLFRGTRLRASTDQVGLARAADGVELVRIGAPLRPEFAAWRYGSHFRTRRRRQLAASAVLLGTAGVAGLAGAVSGLFGVGALLNWGPQVYDVIVNGSPDAVVGRVPHAPGRILCITRAHLGSTRFGRASDGSLVMHVAHDGRTTVLGGADALRAGRILVAAANRYGGSRRDVDDAVGYLGRAGGPDGLLDELVAPERRAARLGRRLLGDTSGAASSLVEIGSSLRLALEMALHEEQEQRAVNGELAELERAWRDAEEVAAVADALALPERVEHAFARLRGRVRPGAG